MTTISCADGLPTMLDYAGIDWSIDSAESPARGLGVLREDPRPWASTKVAAIDGTSIRVTAMPAETIPETTGVDRPPGFLLAGHDRPAVYVSGENASLGVVHELAERVGEVEIAILRVDAAGGEDGVRTALSPADAARAAIVLGSHVVVALTRTREAQFLSARRLVGAAFAEVHGHARLLIPGINETLRL